MEKFVNTNTKLVDSLRKSLFEKSAVYIRKTNLQNIASGDGNSSENKIAGIPILKNYSNEKSRSSSQKYKNSKSRQSSKSKSPFIKAMMANSRKQGEIFIISFVRVSGQYESQHLLLILLFSKNEKQM